MKKRIIRITTVPESLMSLLKGQLRFINSSQDFEIICISSPGIYLEEVSKNEGVKCIPLKMTREITPFADLIAITKLYFILKKLKPHIVHSHTPKAGFIGMTASFLAKIPYRFHTVAGLPLMEKKGFIRKLLIIVEKLTYSLATLIMPNSHGLAEFIKDNKLASERKIKIIGYGSSNGINLDHYNLTESLNELAKEKRRQLGFNDNDTIFLYVGRIVSHKGINELIEAFNMLQGEFGNVKLLLVGGYEENLDPIKDSTKSLIKGNIVHVGLQMDVRPYFLMSDIFVFPSYREGFPNVVLQACSFNLPCIVTDINGSNEIIQNGFNGIIIPPKDYLALYSAMKSFLIDPSLKTRYGECSRDSLLKRFEQKTFWSKILNFYASTL